MFRKALLFIVSASGIAAASAATFSISPASTAYNTTSTITLAVGNVVNGQAVLIEEFADDNGNGLLDTGEQLVMSLAVRDGEASTFPPSSAINRPGDDDGATNGAISKVIRLGAMAERLRVAGAYVFRVSAVDSSFAPIVRPFTIEQGSDPQAVTGTVLSGGNPLGSAFVALLGGGGEGDSELVAGAVSDSNGLFTVRAPVGTYALIALKPGYVVDFGTAPMVDLTAGVISTQSITLVAATRTISGRVIDGTTSNGIGGLQIFVQSEQGAAALAFTDASGAFTVPVTDDMWEIEVSDLSAGAAGYGRTKGFADTTSSDVSGLQLPLSRALGRFDLAFFFPSGSFNDSTNGIIHFPTRLEYFFGHYDIDDSNPPTNVVFTGPVGSGLNNTPSEYGGTGSDWASYNSHSVQVPSYPPGGAYVVNYKGYPQTFLLADPDAANRQLVILPNVVVNPSGQLQEVRWTYRNTSGNLIPPPAFLQSVELHVDGQNGQLYQVDLSPWTASHTLSSSVMWANVQSLQMSYRDDRNNQYTAIWMRSSQPLQMNVQTLPGAAVGVPYQYQFVASGGRPPCSWSMVSGTPPAGINFASSTAQLTGTAQANGTSNFRLSLTDNYGTTIEKDFTLTVGVPSPRLEIRPGALPGEFGLRILGEVGRSYSLQYSTTLTSWTTLMTTNLSAPSADLVDRSATNQLRVYRVLVNP